MNASRAMLGVLVALAILAAFFAGPFLWGPAAAVAVVFGLVVMVRSFTRGDDNEQTRPGGPPGGPGASSAGESGYDGRVTVGDEGAAQN